MVYIVHQCRNEIHTFKDEKLHSYNGKPAYESFYPTGEPHIISYYKNGQLHNKLGPSRIVYYINGDIKELHFHKNGNWHNLLVPALQMWYENKQIARQECRIDGKLCNLIEGEPAQLEWYPNGQLKICGHYVDGTLMFPWNTWDVNGIQH